LTHGFVGLDQAAGKRDVAALVEAGGVSPDMFPQIPTVDGAPGYVVYGPLREAPLGPDVVFLRLTAKQAMVMADALPEIQFEGKPQCHIIPMAKEQDRVAVSVGCMLSRVRTGMPASEMTCAIPGHRVEEVVSALEHACQAAKQVAAYVSEVSRRLGGAATSPS